MPERNFDWPAFRELTVGMGGVGKSTAFIKRLQAEKAQYYFIFDHKHEIGRKLKKKYCYTLNQLIEATKRGGWICFDPVEMFPGDKMKAFVFFCDYVYRISGELKGRKIMVCDELQALHSKMQRPKELMLVLDDGRCFQLDFMAIGQATNALHNEVRGQITDFYTFKQIEENAIKDLRDRGYVEDEVRALQPGEWIYRNINSPETVKGGAAFQAKPKGNRNAGTAGQRRTVEKCGQ